ncbi:exonuclease RecJ [Halorarum halophilum]|uniref:Exonuclease RecJ n=1 Tax=Halorarum halophilum TaxID=2743090 RepID=A0A7D5K056_9EURY|nr:exonuclease RecJ [Halobaculum halophilum]QLG26521.1 exonuclease RecJ [Halobaculum halophilum]
MSTTRAADSPAPDAVATALREADFIRLCPRPTGDALAAAGLLAYALRSTDTPFQVRTTRAATAPEGDGTAFALGWVAPDATFVPTGDRPVSVVAAEVSEELGVDPDPLVGLAGVVAAESAPGADGSGSLLEAAERTGAVDRRSGVAVPTADPAEGLANSTLLRAPYSDDADAARALLADLDYPAEPDDDDRRRFASVVALDATTDGPQRAAEAVGRALQPYATPRGPFATLGGYADVLGATAREAPGLGVALALGNDVVREAALDAWRSHAAATHGLLSNAGTARYDGAFVLRVDADPETTTALATAARLARDFLSPEPMAVVVTDGAAAAAGTDGTDVTRTLETAAGVGSACGDAREGEVRFDGEADEFVDGLRGAL